ncbi:MAG: hypothetical protein RLZZ165_2236 [Bacteroidota bacterium]
MKKVKILLHNIADTGQRELAEQEMEVLLDEGYTIIGSHTDFEMAGSTRVIMMTVILQK